MRALALVAGARRAAAGATAASPAPPALGRAAAGSAASTPRCYVDNAPEAAQAAVRGRAAGHDRGAAQRPQAAQAVPRHPRPGPVRRRAGPALDRLPPRLRAATGASTSTTSTTTATSRSTSSSASAASRPAPSRDSRRKVIEIPHPGSPNHNGGQLQFGARRPALPRHRRRRRRRRPGENAQNPEQPARQAAADRPAPQAAATASPELEPVRRRGRAPTRSTRSGCATRCGSPSTADGGDLRSATSARTPGRRSTTLLAADARGANFGWDNLEGTHLFEAPGTEPASGYARRSTSTQRRHLRGHRAATSSATRGCRRSPAGCCTPTLRRRDPLARPGRAEPERDRRRHRPRDRPAVARSARAPAARSTSPRSRDSAVYRIVAG